MNTKTRTDITTLAAVTLPSSPRGRKKSQSKSALEDLALEKILAAIAKLPVGSPEIAIQREYKFHPRRKWQADFALPDLHILVEIEGGTWVGGRHSRGYGYAADCEKYNAAAILGWSVLRFTGAMVKDKVNRMDDVILYAILSKLPVDNGHDIV